VRTDRAGRRYYCLEMFRTRPGRIQWDTSATTRSAT
jgi:hypothetical protein